MSTDIKEFARNRAKKTILVGESALALNHLIYGLSYWEIYTNVESMNMCSVDNVIFGYYHFHDDYGLKEISENLYLPSAEKAIFDTIVWLPENANEGFLIEALQSYQEHNDKSKLYECADHYGVPHEFIDYWWKEAEEESDMSMG
jgi:hypothetical protein